MDHICVRVSWPSIQASIAVAKHQGAPDRKGWSNDNQGTKFCRCCLQRVFVEGCQQHVFVEGLTVVGSSKSPELQISSQGRHQTRHSIALHPHQAYPRRDYISKYYSTRMVYANPMCPFHALASCHLILLLIMCTLYTYCAYVYIYIYN